MNRINQLFKLQNEKIQSVYFTAGYPELNQTAHIIQELQNGGVNLIEIGIPFSDPMADGPVIQRAATQALKNGMSLQLLFEQLQHVRHDVHIPLILMGYLNPIMQYGFEAFCHSCKACGVDGMIIPDLPFHDYQQYYRTIAEKYDLKIIMLITPETSEKRVHLIDENTDGFIYMVSSAATTGAQNSFDASTCSYFKRTKALNLRNPLLVGFGISNRATFLAACEHASGAIIGSKFVSLLGKEKDIASAVDKLIKNLQE